MWTLIILVTVISAGRPAATLDHVEFASREACELAAESIQRNVAPDRWTSMKVMVGCFQK